MTSSKKDSKTKSYASTIESVESTTMSNELSTTSAKQGTVADRKEITKEETDAIELTTTMTTTNDAVVFTTQSDDLSSEMTTEIHDDITTEIINESLLETTRVYVSVETNYTTTNASYVADIINTDSSMTTDSSYTTNDTHQTTEIPFFTNNDSFVSGDLYVNLSSSTSFTMSYTSQTDLPDVVTASNFSSLFPENETFIATTSYTLDVSNSSNGTTTLSPFENTSEYVNITDFNSTIFYTGDVDIVNMTVSTETMTTNNNISTMIDNETMVTTMEPVIMPTQNNVTYLFIFNGNCTYLLSNETSVLEFKALLLHMLRNNSDVDILTEDLILGDILCGSITINVTFINLNQSDIRDHFTRLKSLLNNTISLNIDNSTEMFTLYDIILISDISDAADESTTNIIISEITTETIPAITDSTFLFKFSGDCSILIPHESVITTDSSQMFTNSDGGDSTTEPSGKLMHAITAANQNTINNNEVTDTSNIEISSISNVVSTDSLAAVTEKITTQILIEFDDIYANLTTKEQFQAIFTSKITGVLRLVNVSSNDTAAIEVGNVTCGSVLINLTVSNTNEFPIIDDTILNLKQQNSAFVITVKDSDGNFHSYRLDEVELLSSPWMTTPLMLSTSKLPDVNIIDEGLTEVELIVIIIFSVVGGSLLILLLSFVIYRCCTTRNSKSFTLGETPNHQLRLEDFTLTKMNRPTPVYTDQGVILTTNVGQNRVRSSTPYNNPMYEQGGVIANTSYANNGHYYENNKASAPEPVNRSFTSTENLVQSGRSGNNGSRMVHPGIENPSFSSDDILDLDSGSNTSTELPYDMKVNPSSKGEKYIS